MIKIIAMCLVMLLIVGCSRRQSDRAVGSGALQLEEETILIVERPLEGGAPIPKIMECVQYMTFTVDDFIYDINHLLRTLEENFALFDVAYWARGVDIRQLTDNARTAVLAAYDIDETMFHNILREHFRPLNNFAHFHISTPPRVDVYIPCVEYSAEELMQIALGQDILLPVADEAVYIFINGLAEPSRLPEFWEIYSQLFGGEFADEVIYYIKNVNFIGLVTLMKNFFNMPEFISTEILENERIAYMLVSSPMPHDVFPEDVEKMAKFFYEIRDYEHLIIDFRGNGGGLTQAFIDLVMRPIISEPVTAEGFAFVNSGAFHLLQHRTRMYPHMMTRPPSLIDMLVNDPSFTKLNMDDMERMGYGFRTYKNLTPTCPSFTSHASNQAFSGKIWFLTDERVGSAAQIITWIVEETGFATIVGEITGGNYGGSRIVFLTPRTGIRYTFDLFYVTNSQGRPLEAGTTPHHFNRPNMDALETVLQLIEEGNY